jgi:hypothetical protein
MLNRIGTAEYRLDPDLAAGTDLDGTIRHVVRPEIECAAARQFEARRCERRQRTRRSVLPALSGSVRAESLRGQNRRWRNAIP